MVKGITPEKAIHITWLSVALTLCWPLSVNSGKTQVFVFRVLQIISIVSACMLLLPLSYSIYLHTDDVIVFLRTIIVFVGVAQNIIQTVICFVKYYPLQHVIEEMKICVKEAQKYEIEIFQKYIAKLKTVWGCSITCMYLTALAFTIGPVFMSTPLPCDAEYPFQLNYTPVFAIVYFHQSFLSYQCLAHMCISMFGSLLLWFTAARFECLCVELQNATDIDMLIVCIKKQLHLRRYAKKVINGFRFIIFNAIGLSTLVLTLAGIILITNVPKILKYQFVIVCMTLLAEIYMYTWPADYMTDMSVNVSRKVYDSMWYKQTLKMQKNLLKVLIFQRPVSLSISCILPELTLRYYCSYLSNVFSIFAALRVVIEDNI